MMLMPKQHSKRYSNNKIDYFMEKIYTSKLDKFYLIDKFQCHVYSSFDSINNKMLVLLNGTIAQMWYKITESTCIKSKVKHKMYVNSTASKKNCKE